MGVSDANAVYGDNARFTHQTIGRHITTVAVSQTGLEQFQHTPGFNFEIIRFSVYAVSVTAAVSLNLLIGATTVLTTPLVPVAGAEADGVLLDTGVEYGSATDIIYVQATTDGSGDVTDADVTIWLRRRAADIT